MNNNFQDNIIGSENNYEKINNMSIYYCITIDISKQTSVFEVDSNKYNMYISEFC